MSRPPNVTEPCDACHRPMMVRRVVVFPAPLRPSSIVSLPRGTARSTPCRMWYAPMCVCTPCNVSKFSFMAWLLPPLGEGGDGGACPTSQPPPLPSPGGGGSNSCARSCGLLRYAEVSLLHNGRSNHGRRIAVRHQGAVVQHDDAIGEFTHHVHLVL